jgi:hypothetical protein
MNADDLYWEIVEIVYNESDPHTMVWLGHMVMRHLTTPPCPGGWQAEVAKLMGRTIMHNRLLERPENVFGIQVSKWVPGIAEEGEMTLRHTVLRLIDEE